MKAGFCMNVYLTVVIILVILTIVAVPIARGFVISSVENSLLRQNYDKFDRMIDKWYIKLFIPHFNVDFLKLNRAIMGGTRAEIDKRFEGFDHVNLKENQKENVYLRAFDYYISQDDRVHTDKYYELIKGLENKSIISYADRIYDIYVLNGWTYLDDILKEAGTVSEEQLPEYYSMISTMYQNMGDEKKAREYMNKIQKEIKDGTPGK